MSIRKKFFKYGVGDFITIKLNMLGETSIKLPKTTGIIIAVVREYPPRIILLESSGNKKDLDAEYDFKIGLDWDVEILSKAASTS